MRITKLRILETKLLDALLPRLQGRLFHVSSLSNLDSITESGEIRPNQDGKYTTTFGSSANSFFRNRNCVSLFDYRSVTPEEFDDALGKCSPTRPASPDSGIAIFLLGSSVNPALLPWSLWKQEEAWKEMVVPYVEAGHHGPISLALVDETIVVEVDEDPDSVFAVNRRARKKRTVE